MLSGSVWIQINLGIETMSNKRLQQLRLNFSLFTFIFSLSLLPPEYNKLRKLFSPSEKWKIIALFLMMMVAAVLEVAGIGTPNNETR